MTGKFCKHIYKKRKAKNENDHHFIFMLNLIAQKRIVSVELCKVWTSALDSIMQYERKYAGKSLMILPTEIGTQSKHFEEIIFLYANKYPTATKCCLVCNREYHNNHQCPGFGIWFHLLQKSVILSAAFFLFVMHCIRIHLAIVYSALQCVNSNASAILSSREASDGWIAIKTWSYSRANISWDKTKKNYYYIWIFRSWKTFTSAPLPSCVSVILSFSNLSALRLNQMKIRFGLLGIRDCQTNWETVE